MEFKRKTGILVLGTLWKKFSHNIKTFLKLWSLKLIHKLFCEILEISENGKIYHKQLVKFIPKYHDAPCPRRCWMSVGRDNAEQNFGGFWGIPTYYFANY